MFSVNQLIKSVAVFVSIISFARAWCPSANDTQITCSSCSVTLSCNTSLGISITGSYVDFNGDGYGISNTSGVALAITGDGNYVHDLFIQYPNQSGITFTSNQDPGYASFDEVNIIGSYLGNGLVSNGTQSISINNSDMSYNFNDGVYAYGGHALTHYADFLNSGAAGNNRDGYEGSSRYYSWINYNFFGFNNRNGVGSTGYSNDYLSSNYYHNGADGLSVHDGDPEVRDNTGSANAWSGTPSSYDCDMVGSSGIHSSGNTWGSQTSGCNIGN
jgi:hypothetical protein